MKARNHQERRQTILKFILTLVPFLLLLSLMLSLYRQVGVKHADFIQYKHSNQKELFVDQSQYNERLDSVLVLLDKLMDQDVNTRQYKQLHKLINDKIQHSVSELGNEKITPYELLFLEARKSQAVIDSIYPLKQGHAQNQLQLKTCIKKYNEVRVELKRQEDAASK